MPFDQDFPGPSAPWVNEEETNYAHQLRVAAGALRMALMKRVDALDQPDVTLETLLDEIRRQIAACAVDGHVTLASDLSDLAISLATAREWNNRSL